MISKEEILRNKVIRGLIKLRIERGEIREALEFIRVCLHEFNLREIDEIFQTIKNE
jgi:hypothetical protein